MPGSVARNPVAEYRMFPRAEGISAALVVFVAIGIMSYFIYWYGHQAQAGEIREGLLRTARLAATMIDGDLHKSITSPDDQDTEGHRRALETLHTILNSDENLVYVYTCVLRDGGAYFILDTTPTPSDSDGDGVVEYTHIMEHYDDASDTLLEALTTEQAVVTPNPYEDKWGRFVSAYVPFYDSAGTFVGVVGLDLSAENYYARLNPLSRATVRAMMTGFFIAFLVGSAVWFLRRFSLLINRSRMSLAADLTSRTARL